MLTAMAVGVLFAAPYIVPTSFAGAVSPLRYVVADVAIAGLLAWRLRGRALRQMGFAIPARQAAGALLVLAAAYFGACALVGLVCDRDGIEIVGRHPLFSLSQVLHQEIVLRALLLGALYRRFRSVAGVALAGAVIFTLPHPLLFAGFFGVSTPFVALATLFCFAVATNLLFLRAGHIGFSFALHAAWNVARFAQIYLVDGVLVTQPQSFALFEGSAPVSLAAVFLLLVVVLGEVLRKRWRRPPSPAPA